MQKMRFQLSLDIVHCDGFVSMPATAQALYVQIVSVCDDEGFTSQIEMCKFLTHASDDDVQMLLDRGFILQVGERNVTVVKHWKMNTYLHDGKIVPSKFSERSLVFIKPNGNYTLDSGEGRPFGPIKSDDGSELERNEDGVNTETFGNTSSSRVGQGVRVPRAGSIPNHSIPLHNNPVDTNTNTLHSSTKQTSACPPTHEAPYHDPDDDPF